VNTSPPRAVLFDALGTLFAITPPHVIFSHAMTRLGYQVSENDAARLVARANAWWLDPTRPQARTRAEEMIERREYVEAVLEDAARENDNQLADRLVAATYWPQWVRPYPDALPALQALAGTLQLAVLTNGGPSMQDAVEHAGHAGYFEQVFASLETGVRKPDADAYLSAVGQLNIEPQAVWMVDDTPENVAAAEAAGLRGALVDRRGRYGDWPGVCIIDLEELPAVIGRP